MASSHYARLGRDHATIDVPLSRLSSTSDVYKLPDHQSTFASQDSVIRFKKRGFFGAINGWWLELGSIGLAIAVMLVTIVLLAHYDRKELSETPRRPNLNTLVNIFSTIEASLLVFVAAEILSQSKWLRMQKRSKLDDFNVIDNASRGLRGAVQVLFKPNLGVMAMIGAVATILAIAIGPMLQETVVLRQGWMQNPNRDAFAPVSKFFAPPTNPALPKLDIGLKGTILNGLSAANTSAREPTFACPSGNCTFEQPYTSLGVCHACQRMELTRLCNDANACNYTLANGHTLINNNVASGFGGDFNFINVTTTFDLNGPMKYPNENVSEQFDVVRASIISLTNGPLCYTNGSNPDCILDNRDNATQQQLFDGGAIGMYCDLAMCTNTYSAEISDSRLKETTLASTDARDTALPRYGILATDGLGIERNDPVILPDQCYINGTPYALETYKNSSTPTWTYVDVYQSLGNGSDEYSPYPAKVPRDCVFAMPLVTYRSIAQFMTSNPVFLDGSGTSDSNTGVAGGVFSFIPSGSDASFLFVNQAAFGVEPIFNNGNASFESIDATFGRLANAITTYMRDNSGQSPSASFSGVEAQLAALRPAAQGVLLRSQTIVHVQWYWIILPAVVLFTVVAYLIAAIVQGGVKDLDGNTQAHLWKSSAIVPLVIGQRSQLHGSEAALKGHEMMQVLKGRKMKLAGSKGGWMFMEVDGDGAG